MELHPVAFRAADFQGKAPDVIVETMISCDEVDDFAVDPPEELWPYEGMIVYNVAANDIERTKNAALSESLGRVISYGGQVNDYRLEGETIMMSIAPATARAIVERYRSATATLVHEDQDVSQQDVRDYFQQWIALLTWASDHQMALVLHAG
jgi:hypothetical protein